MSYTQLTDEVIVSGKKLTGFALETVENDSNGNPLFTTIVYFDANFNEVGQKFTDHANNETSTILRVYSDLAAGDYKEYGEQVTKDGSNNVTDQVAWDFDFESDKFKGGTETEGASGSTQVSTTFDANWGVASTSATIGSGAGTEINQQTTQLLGKPLQHLHRWCH